MSESPDGRAAGLDPSVVAQLYVAHSDELRRFLLGLTRDHQLVNDVLQATFAKLVERGHETQDASRKAWLFRVAYNEAMAILRRRSVGDRVVRQVAWAEPENVGPADERLLRLESIERVRNAIRDLPPNQMRIVELRIYEEKTFAVISEELNIPLGTALARMRAAMKKLRTALSNDDGDEDQ